MKEDVAPSEVTVENKASSEGSCRAQITVLLKNLIRTCEKKSMPRVGQNGWMVLCVAQRNRYTSFLKFFGTCSSCIGRYPESEFTACRDVYRFMSSV